MFTIENVISDVTLSQHGCEVHEDGLVIIDSGASVNVHPNCLAKSKLQLSDGAIRLRGADERPVQEYGKRQIWLKIGGQTKRYDFHARDKTDLECQLLVRTWSRDTSRKAPLLEVW